VGGLSLRGVAKRYGPVEVMRDLSLEIDEGEFAVFLGPSGCGKSTLLRMVAGLETLSAGEIHLGARRIDGLPPGERGVAMVFQHYALYPHMTVRQNMAFGLRNIGTPTAVIRTKVDAAAHLLEIGHLLDRRPTQLSGGQRQRVAIGRAIVKQPTAFLFDEPLSNLDAALRSRTRVELARLHQTMRATMVFVTHDQMEAMTLATRIVVLNAGRIEQVGTPSDIYARPNTRFVAGFIGTPAMNFLPVDAIEEQGGRAVAMAGGIRVATGVPIGLLASGTGLTLGVRAEHIHAGEGPPATVEVLERLGDRTLIYARGTDGNVLVYDEPGHAPVSVGDQVLLSIDGAAVHLFDPAGRVYHAAEPARA
jgi:multiple sugar transport system ATP-binding protein